jgi:hypothetical protein
MGVLAVEDCGVRTCNMGCTVDDIVPYTTQPGHGIFQSDEWHLDLHRLNHNRLVACLAVQPHRPCHAVQVPQILAKLQPLVRSDQDSSKGAHGICCVGDSNSIAVAYTKATMCLVPLRH